MRQADPSSLSAFGKLVPGFDFLQNLAQQAAGSAAQSLPQMPNLGSWVAPTINVEELDKRIEELKAVQFWLDQNAMALKATIQALEVQKMTLATLKGMNFNLGDVANAFKLKVADSVADGVQRVADTAKSFSAQAPRPAASEQQEAAPAAPAGDAGKSSGKEASPGAAGMIDPMQWWGALTQQFQTIAVDAMKDAAKKTAIDTTKHMAAGLAKDALQTATGMAKSVADSATKSVTQSVTKTARAAMGSVARGAYAWPQPAAKAPALSAPRKSGAKKASQAATKPAAKPAAKAPAKSAAKSAPKPAAKSAAKSAPRATAKAAAKPSAKSAPRRARKV